MVYGRGSVHAGPQEVAPRLAARPKANVMERVVGILIGVLAGLCAGLAAVVLGTLGTMGSTPPDTPERCVGLMVAPLVVGGLCGGWVSWRLPERRRRWRR